MIGGGVVEDVEKRYQGLRLRGNFGREKRVRNEMRRV